MADATSADTHLVQASTGGRGLCNSAHQSDVTGSPLMTRANARGDNDCRLSSASMAAQAGEFFVHVYPSANRATARRNKPAEELPDPYQNCVAIGVEIIHDGKRWA